MNKERQGTDSMKTQQIDSEYLSVSGIVFDIKKAAIHDGPGLRTTVFVKGCPLTCIWCHNPESIRPQPEIKYLSMKCTGCGACVRACAQACHSIKAGAHTIDRTRCIQCGSCTDACPAEALELIGRPMSAEEVLGIVIRDRAFFESSGGGMTISGGEPMAQFEFTRTLLQGAKALGLHTCLDTCGFARTDNYTRIRKYTDIFLFDVKETDPERHREFTGRDNVRILDNLRHLDRLGAGIILRCPIVPGCNDRKEHLTAIGRLADSLNNVSQINVMAFHPFGAHKSEQIGSAYTLQHGKAVDKKTADSWRRIIRTHTRVPVT